MRTLSGQVRGDRATRVRRVRHAGEQTPAPWFEVRRCLSGESGGASSRDRNHWGMCDSSVTLTINVLNLAPRG
jgi:hypothetical protein